MLIACNNSKVSSILAAARNANMGETFVVDNDNEALRTLKAEADKYSPEQNEGRRLECWLLLGSPTSLWLLQTGGLADDVQKKVDVFAVTADDLMAKSLFARLPATDSIVPPLDRKPIGLNSTSTVHLVIFGASDLTEAIAVNAALTAHYPNYCRDHRLRTRITIVAEDIFEWRDRLVQRYRHLFDNSFHRSINLDDDNPQCVCHRPMYCGEREDFVDVEWEFVNGSAHNSAMRAKLEEWSASPTQQLTVAMCIDNPQDNFSETFALPESVYLNNTPVICHTEDDELIATARNNPMFATVMAFGSKTCSLETLAALKGMAKRVNYVYNYCFSLSDDRQVCAPAEIDIDEADRLWDSIPTLTKQYSNIFNAMTIGAKMHSLGHEPNDWHTYYALSRQEVDTLTEVEHNRWSVEELILGFRPVDNNEQAAVENDIAMKKKLRNEKVHYDLRAFSDLRPDATGKNVDIYDRALTQSIPLIVKTCITD